MKSSGVLILFHLLLITPPEKTLVLCKSPPSDTQTRIVGGFACDIRNIPFLVAIFTRQMCGGSLLTYSWVLTAGHCVKPANVNGAEAISKVRTGYNLPDNFVQERRFKRTIMHPRFIPENLRGDKELRFDIALIELVQPFEPSPVAQLAKLPEKGFAARCSTMLAAGIGLMASNENIGTNLNQIVRRQLMCVELKAFHDLNFCQQGYPRANMDQTIFCTSDPGKDTCSGDSGGPMICDGVVVGLVSYGPKVCGTGIATYTKVEEYLDFIKSHVMEKKGTRRSETVVRSSAQKHHEHKNVFFLMLIMALVLF